MGGGWRILQVIFWLLAASQALGLIGSLLATFEVASNGNGFINRYGVGLGLLTLVFAAGALVSGRAADRAKRKGSRVDTEIVGEQLVAPPNPVVKDDTESAREGAGADAEKKPASAPERSTVNWTRGLRRVFWLLSAIWLISAAMFAATNSWMLPPAPRRLDFVPSCSASMHAYSREIQCGQSPSPYLSDERHNVYASCVAALDVRRIEEARACNERNESAVVQEDIERAYDNAILLWVGQIALLIALTLALPFLLAAMFVGMWRIVSWIKVGFSAQT